MVGDSPDWEEERRALGTGDKVRERLSEDEGRRGETSVDSGRGTEVGDWRAPVLQADGIDAVDGASTTDPESCFRELDVKLASSTPTVCAGVSESTGSSDGPAVSVEGRASFNDVVGRALSQRGSEL